MTTPATGTRICKFPGCRRPVEPATGAPGRPGAYCDDAEHTAVRAWRARRAEMSEAAGESDDLGRPVAMATARAGMLRDELVKTAEQLSEQLGRGVQELRNLTDPDAAAAQVETVAAESAQQVTAAEVARNPAEATARQAQSDLAEANDAAQALDDQLQQATAARVQSDRLRQEALAAAPTTVETLTGDLATRTGERDQLQTRVDELTRELTSTGDQLHAETRRADEVTARADRDRGAAEKSIGQMEARLTDSTARAGELDRQLAITRVELDTSHAAQARLEAQLAAATQRTDEANARTHRPSRRRARARRRGEVRHTTGNPARTRTRPHRRTPRRPRPADHQPDRGHPSSAERGTCDAGRRSRHRPDTATSHSQDHPAGHASGVGLITRRR